MSKTRMIFFAIVWTIVCWGTVAFILALNNMVDCGTGPGDHAICSASKASVLERVMAVASVVYFGGIAIAILLEKMRSADE